MRNFSTTFPAFVAALFAMLLAGNAPAAEIDGVRLADTMSLGGHELLLNGGGVRTRVVFRVYVASLYLPQKAADLQAALARSPRRIQLNLLRKLSAEQLIDALDEGLAQNNTAAELAAIKPRTEQLAQVMKTFGEIKDKDVIALDYIDGATQLSLNGDVKGSIQDEAFNQALMKIWLGDKPVQASLKKALLGG